MKNIVKFYSTEIDTMDALDKILNAFYNQMMHLFNALETLNPNFEVSINIKCSRDLFIGKCISNKKTVCSSMMINFLAQKNRIKQKELGFFLDDKNPLFYGVSESDLKSSIEFIKSVSKENSDNMAMLWTYIEELLRISEHFEKIQLSNKTIAESIVGEVCNFINFVSYIPIIEDIVINNEKITLKYSDEIRQKKLSSNYVYKFKEFPIPTRSKSLIKQNILDYFKLCPDLEIAQRVLSFCQ